MNDPSPDDLPRVLQIVDSFEDAWRDGECPRIADHLTGVTDTLEAFLVTQLLRVELELRRAGGEAPTPGDYATSLAGWEHVVRDVFAQDVDPADLPTASSERTPPAAHRTLELEGFRILGVVGRGGMGVVYKGWQEGLQRLVAIKTTVAGVSGERFRREANLIGQIRSRHVVAVHGLQTLRDGTLLLVMDFIEGGTLADRIKAREGPIPERDVLPWMDHVADGMQAASERQIVHRDLKPSNILIDGEGCAMVADFGLGRGPSDPGFLTQSDAVIGTPYYMAPEQAEDPQGVDARADIYSFGATFYHALTGTPPFGGKTTFAILYNHKTEPLTAPKARNPGLSDRVCEVLERCLAKSPADRFPSFAALRAQLRPTPASPSPWEMPEDPAFTRYVEIYKARRPAYLHPASPLGPCDRFEFPNGRVLTILRGDLVEQRADALVSSEFFSIPMNFGVALALRRAAGEDVAREAMRFAPARPGRVVVTSAGRLPTRFLFHGITHGLHREDWVPSSRDLIAEIMAGCFYHADTLDVRSIALPLLGTGGGGFSREVCLDTMFRYLARMFLHGLTCVKDARIVIYPIG